MFEGKIAIIYNVRGGGAGFDVRVIDDWFAYEADFVKHFDTYEEAFAWTLAQNPDDIDSPHPDNRDPVLDVKYY